MRTQQSGENSELSRQDIKSLLKSIMVLEYSEMGSEYDL